MPRELEILLYVLTLIAFPFIVQLLTIPLCIVAEIIEVIFRTKK